MSKCEACGADIIWATTDVGKVTPLSIASREKRFILQPLPRDILLGKMVDTYISHFADCPNTPISHSQGASES